MKKREVVLAHRGSSRLTTVRCTAALTVAALIFMALGASCFTPTLDNRPCTADGACLPGYVCDAHLICVESPTEGLAGSGPRCGALGQLCCESSADCGTACQPDACACRTGLIACGQKCADTSSDSSNCGVCGRACESSTPTACLAGRCAPVCLTGLLAATGSSPWAIAADDFNRDGRLDLVVANRDSNSVSVLLRNSAGAFLPKVDYGVGASPSSVVVGDFDRDTWPDFAVIDNSNRLRVLLGKGDGTFRSGASLATGFGPIFTLAQLRDVSSDQ